MSTDESGPSRGADEIRKVDLVIIGSGPAGISTALHLIQQDPSWSGRMLLLERASHPRDKLCGGGLTYFGLQNLQKLGFRLPLPLPQVEIDELRFRYRQREFRARGTPLLAVFQRSDLDAHLAREARRRGAIVLENETARSIEPGDQGVLVKTDRGRYLARTVVGADGSRGIVRRSVYGGSGPSRVGRTLDVVHPAPLAAPHYEERYAVFDFTQVDSRLQGYFWEMPSYISGRRFFNRGVYDARFFRGKPPASLPLLLEKSLRGLGSPAKPEDLEGHPIRWFSPGNRFSAARILLVGDAAGADPLLGEGIAPALGYGAVASRAIDHAFKEGDFTYRDYRRRLFLSPVGRYLLVRSYFAWWSFRLSHQPWFMHTLWTVAVFASRVLPRPAVATSPPHGR